MFNLQKSASDRTGLRYDFSSPSIASTSTTIFVPPANNVETENNEVKNELVSENIDKGKSILGAPPKQDKKEAKNPRVKKANSQKPKQKKQHLCHHCGAAGHTRPNYYKWLATQQSNGMIASRNQNQFPSSFAPLGDLLKALMFLSNLNGFNSSPHLRFKDLLDGKVLPRYGRKRAPGDSVTSSSVLPFFCFCLHYLCVLLYCFESV